MHGADGGIEMRATEGAEHLDQHIQPADRGQRIGQQGQCRVATGEALRHDPGADDDGQQQQEKGMKPAQGHGGLTPRVE